MYMKMTKAKAIRAKLIALGKRQSQTNRRGTCVPIVGNPQSGKDAKIYYERADPCGSVG